MAKSITATPDDNNTIPETSPDANPAPPESNSVKKQIIGKTARQNNEQQPENTTGTTAKLMCIKNNRLMNRHHTRVAPLVDESMKGMRWVCDEDRQIRIRVMRGSTPVVDLTTATEQQSDRTRLSVSRYIPCPANQT